MSKTFFPGATLAGVLAAVLLAAAPAAQAQSAPAAVPSGGPQLVSSFSSSPTRFTQQGGETLYRSICQGCHMAGGEGAKNGAGFFPDLRSNPKLAAGAYPALVVLNGLHGMPPFAAWMDDQQVADVVNYIRTHFNNQYSDALTPQSVAGLRTPAK